MSLLRAPLRYTPHAFKRIKVASVRGPAAHQVVGVHVAVHAHVGPAGRQVPDYAPRARPEVLERVLRVDAALNGVPLRAKGQSPKSAATSTGLPARSKQLRSVRIIRRRQQPDS